MIETWTVKKVLDWTISHFKNKDIPEYRLSAELLLAHVLACKRIELYLQFERILSQSERQGYKKLIQRRLKREPVQYILGETEFMGFPFRVAPGVLIPRSDTEILVDCVFSYLNASDHPSPRVLDVGTGSGCIAISLAKLFPAAEVWAVDKSARALLIAGENARLNKVDIHFVEGDFFEIYPTLNCPFDILVANPPYIAEKEWGMLAPEVREHEPAEALFGGKDGLEFYQRVIPVIEKSFQDSVVFLEVGYQQAGCIAELFSKQNWRVDIEKDYQQIERVLSIHRKS